MRDASSATGTGRLFFCYVMQCPAPYHFYYDFTAVNGLDIRLIPAGAVPAPGAPTLPHRRLPGHYPDVIWVLPGRFPGASRSGPGASRPAGRRSAGSRRTLITESPTSPHRF